MDIETLASTISGWHRTNKSPAEMSRDLAEAVSASLYGQISTLIVPCDHQWAEVTNYQISAPRFSFTPLDFEAIERTARMMRAHQKSALLLGGRALRRKGLMAAARIKSATGCDLICHHVPAYMERGVGLPVVTRVPYFPRQAIDLLSRYDLVVLADMKEPVAFFGYKDERGRFLSEAQTKVELTNAKQSVVEVLEYLAEALGAHPGSKVPDGILAKPSRPAIPEGELTAEKAGAILAAIQPEGAIIVDEAVTSGSAYYSASAGLPPYTFLAIAGGAIGYGLPCATGAAIACPNRQVINLEADGSAMYTFQALWTQARESLNVITLLCSNRSYNILKIELARAGVASPPPKVLSLMELDRPFIDWVSLAKGMGVPAVSVDTAEGLLRELRKALSRTGPRMIEMRLSPAKRPPKL
jgi:acetolactate synthase-1/2/3 large subunit